MWGRRVFNFIRKGPKISNVGAQFHIQPATREMQLLCTLVILFHFISSGGREGLSQCGFHLHFANDSADHLCHAFVPFPIPSYVTCQVKTVGGRPSWEASGLI